MKRQGLVGLILAAAVALVTGCSSAPSGSIYKSSEALKPQEVRMGKLLSVEVIKIDTKGDTTMGTVAGGAIGGIAGSQMGSGKGAQGALGAVIGATVGAIAGSTVQNMTNKEEAYELTVQMEDDGKIMSIVQASDEAFTAGERVRVLVQGGKYRIAPYRAAVSE